MAVQAGDRRTMGLWRSRIRTGGSNRSNYFERSSSTFWSLLLAPVQSNRCLAVIPSNPADILFVDQQSSSLLLSTSCPSLLSPTVTTQMHSKSPSAVTVLHALPALPARPFQSCVPIDEFLIYACDFSLAILSGLVFALFNLLIGRYLTVSVSNNGHPEQFPLLQCIIHFLCAGLGLALLGFLHHVSVNSENPTIRHKLSPAYRRMLGIFIRDLTYLVASIVIAFSRSWTLTVPILLVPILVTAWTTLLQKQKPPIVRGLFLAGPICFFFLNMSLGGLYGTKLVDLGLLDQPGVIFTIVAGIGSSAVQFSKARAQFKPFLPHHAPQMYVHDENLDKPEYEKNPIEVYFEDAQVSSKSNGNEKKTMEFVECAQKTKFSEMLRIWAQIQLLMLKCWPALWLIGLLACLVHAFGYPVFTRLTGLFFSVFELKLDASTSLTENIKWICLAYGTMGILVFFAVTSWNAILGNIGIRLRKKLHKKLEMLDIELVQKVDWQQIQMIPLLCTEFFYGTFCMLISMASSLQNNRPMGILAISVFSGQVLLQHVACCHFNKSKFGRALGFASTNGMQQVSQALCYTGGFVLAQFGLVTPLNVFKIIQTMHLGSMGLTSVVLLANDFANGSRELKLAMGGNPRRISPGSGSATP